MKKLIILTEEELATAVSTALESFIGPFLDSDGDENHYAHEGFENGVAKLKHLVAAHAKQVVNLELLEEKLPIVQAQIALQDAGFMVKNSQNLMLIVDLFARRPSAIEVAAALPEGVNLSAVFFAGSPVYLFADETAELAFVKSMKLDCRPPRDL